MTQIKDIVQNNLCIGCGVCVSEMPDKIKMEVNNQGFIVANQIKEGTSSALRVCPFNPNPEPEVYDEDAIANIFIKSDTTKYDRRIGHYIQCYAGYSKKFRSFSSSGGIGTYAFEYLLKFKKVDKIYVVVEKNGGYEYGIFGDVATIEKTSKTRYLPVTLHGFFEDINNVDGKVALSGVPSFIKAVRLKQYYYPQLQDKIIFLSGIVCGGMKSKFYTDYLAQKIGITGAYRSQDYRIKDRLSSALDYSFGAFEQSSGEYKREKMARIGDTWGTMLFSSQAYDFSDDLVAELADISLGDAWLPRYTKDGEGNSVIVTRTKLADEIIKYGISKGELCLHKISVEEFKKTQNGGLKHKQIGMEYRANVLRKKSSLLPIIRSRLLEPIPFEFKLVQKQRQKIRDLSPLIWRSTNNCTKFDEKIHREVKKLRLYTRIYHKIQKMKKFLGLEIKL